MTIQEIQCIEYFFRRLKRMSEEKYNNYDFVEDMYDEYNNMLQKIIEMNSSISSAEIEEREEV